MACRCGPSGATYTLVITRLPGLPLPLDRDLYPLRRVHQSFDKRAAAVTVLFGSARTQRDDKRLLNTHFG